MKRICVMLLGCLIAQNAQADSIATVITESGTYIFGDLANTPTDGNDACIIVQANNVIIDFQGHAITQSNSVDGFSGIVVNSGFSNITIRNVKISGLTGKGIVVQDTCTDIFISSVDVELCLAAGIELDGTLTNHIINVDITDSSIISCTGAGASTAYGVRLVRVDNADLGNLTVLQNDAGTIAAGYGISLEFCSSSLVNNCRLNQNGGNSLGVGIGLFNSVGVSVENCEVLNTVARLSSTGEAVGVRLDTCTDCIIRNIDTAGNSNLVATAYGFEAVGGAGNIFENCSGIGNIGGTQAAGFRFGSSESNSSIADSQSRDNNGGSSGQGVGILLDTAQYCDILYNEVMDNKGLTGYGLIDTVTNTNNLIAGNIAFRNTTQSYSVTRGILDGAFPVLSAQVGNFSAIAAASQYMNIDFTVGP